MALLTARVFHPDHLQRGALILVDHPVVRPLQDGDGQGWEGDPRLAVYLRARQQRFEVWRLEDDGQYRRVCQAPPGRTLTPQAINRLIGRLVSIDTHRGFDPVAAVDHAETATDKARDAAMADRVRNDLADRLAHALKRDGADRYC